MARGFLSGLLWGGLVAVAGGVGLAIYAGPPRPAPAEATDLRVPAGSGFARGREDEAAALPGADAGPDRPAADRVAPPEPDDLARLQATEREAGARPQTASPATSIAQPPTPAQDGPALHSERDGAVGTSPAAAPEAPVSEPAPAQPGRARAPDAAQETGGTLVAPDAPDASAEGPSAREEAAPDTPAASAQPGAATADSEPRIDASAARPEAASRPGTGLAPPQAAPGSGPEPEAGADAPVFPSPGAPAPRAPRQDGGPEVSTAPAQPAPGEPGQEAGESATQPPQPAAPEPPEERAEPGPDPDPGAPRVEADDSAALAPSIGRRAGDLDSLAPEVSTNRLPTVADPPATSAPDGAPGDTSAAPPPDAPPLERFAVAFETEGDKPLMSVVLIDDAETGLPPAALESLSFPVSVAVAAGAPDAAARMRAWRDQGREVLALGGLPEGATPQDTEVSLAAWLSAVPEAVAVMELREGALQPSRQVSEQLAAYLADSGHGLVLFPRGLDTGAALAERAGVPAATVFRDFDGAGQDGRAMRRFLDNAAFRARQEGAVIMVGRLRPDTLSALTFWALQDRAGDVSLAPLSAVLSAQD